MFDNATSQVIAVLLIALRVGPTLAFAPPFTLVKLPALARAAMISTLALAMLPSASPERIPNQAGALIAAAASEIALGIGLALALQIVFALIGVAGRAIDTQSGFGLASIIDPTTRAQNPLISAIFTYAAAAVFFTTTGPSDVIQAFAASFQKVPLGSTFTLQIDAVLTLLGAASIISLGVVGLALTILFVIDLIIALLSRTLPQMNVLVFGFQVKAMVVLLVVPATIALGAAAIVRILRLASEAMISIA